MMMMMVVRLVIGGAGPAILLLVKCRVSSSRQVKIMEAINNKGDEITIIETAGAAIAEGGNR